LCWINWIQILPHWVCLLFTHKIMFSPFYHNINKFYEQTLWWGQMVKYVCIFVENLLWCHFIVFFALLFPSMYESLSIECCQTRLKKNWHQRRYFNNKRENFQRMIRQGMGKATGSVFSWNMFEGTHCVYYTVNYMF
jgi:hypothetical protein